MTLDFKLDRDSNDLVIGLFDFVLAKDIDAVAQQITIRLKSFLTEWFLDQSYGLPYLTQIFSKQTPRSRVDALMKEQIITVPHVQEIVSFSTFLDAKRRAYYVNFVVKTDFGTLKEYVRI